MKSQLVRSSVAGAILGVSIYVGADVFGEYTTYCTLRDQGLAFANQDSALVEQIGTPFDSGPWYNASIGFAQSGHIAAVTFPLKGSKQITDVTVRAVRRPGVPSTALYNVFGGEWKVLDCSAMLPQGGGNVRPRSIMPYQPVPDVQDGKVVTGSECVECSQKGSSRGTQMAAGTAAAGISGANTDGRDGAGGGEVDSPAAGEKKRRKRFWFF
ncbi:hypothetical protein Vretimale_19623 [Volvox reticuliferus]|uniref:Uncharacterized protein n=1 Tax=Volvox reticuliferus TaxID=1737510 RepID=A0A8J4GX39_9CHLO|nr:hypothetical protein Vretifemale_16674 [Volvox reticuliferus]GIM17083.1 hypothetical protein Vretimale_19623 [Volvox reticuliferus]